jgi:hypothetical protein
VNKRRLTGLLGSCRGRRGSLVGGLAVGVVLCVAGAGVVAVPALAVGSSVAGGLIDGRAWELVTPVNKHGAALRTSESEEGGILEASEAGDGLMYDMTGDPVEGAEGSRPLEAVPLFATRTATGWESRDIQTPNNTLGAWQPGNNDEYKVFTSDLSAAVVEPPGNTPLAAGQTGAEQTLYLRDDLTNTFSPLVTSANVPAATNLDEDSRKIKFLGASTDLQHVVVGSELKLTAEPEESKGMYEWNKGQSPQAELQPVSVLPDHEFTSGELGSAPSSGAEQGYTGLAVRNAISSDGSLIVWEASDSHLYVRDMETQETVQVDALQAGASGEGVQAPEFQGAAGQTFQEGASGPSQIYFTDQQRLTADSHAGQESRDLYVAEITGKSPLNVTVKDLTPEIAGEPAGVRPSILGYGQSGTSVDIYYMAEGALTPGYEHGDCDYESNEHPGSCKLYLEQYEGQSKTWLAPRLIATLSAGDISDWGNGVGPTHLEQQTVRVSANGQYLAFMSEEPLTGYDNLDANSGEPDSEVFLFDAQTDGVRCVSCNPTGAQPAGVQQPKIATTIERPLVDPSAIFKGKWLAANLMGWDTSGKAHAIYQPRYLSDAGRVFFDSSDALVPADSNGTQDVYEYEPEGAPGGLCDAATQSTTEVYVHDAEEVAGATGGLAAGCVGLISSGTSGYESAFLDANESGSDVFFATRAELAPQDVDDADDIYDAHECSEASPCMSVSMSTSTSCSSTETCRAPGSGTVAGVSGAPASTTSSGSGNLAPAAAVVVKAKAKAPTRAQKLAAALKSCRKKRNKRKRAVCERQSRAKYGPAKAKKANRRGRS